MAGGIFCYTVAQGLMLLSGTSPWRWKSEVVKLSDLADISRM